MSHVALRKILAATAFATLALAMIATAPPAKAHHDRPVRLCEAKFKGQFHPFRQYPIKTSGGRRLGRLAITFQGPVERRGVSGWRACAVTVLKRHKRRRFANVAVRQADDRRWRSDPGRWRRYAGPVVRWSPYVGNCLLWRGKIGGATRVLKGYCA